MYQNQSMIKSQLKSTDKKYCILPHEKLFLNITITWYAL